jgi:N4-(beta-N-acetylglucosaminyl)-L-asparaginase
MIVIDEKGDIAAGTSTNGASHKIPGRVGDSPIIGSGAYVDNEVGAACGTGDGDTLMKYLPAYQAVESMRNGMSTSESAQDAIERIVRREPNFSGAILVIDKLGNHGKLFGDSFQIGLCLIDFSKNESSKINFLKNL